MTGHALMPPLAGGATPSAGALPALVPFPEGARAAAPEARPAAMPDFAALVTLTATAAGTPSMAMGPMPSPVGSAGLPDVAALNLAAPDAAAATRARLDAPGPCALRDFDQLLRPAGLATVLPAMARGASATEVDADRSAHEEAPPADLPATALAPPAVIHALIPAAAPQAATQAEAPRASARAVAAPPAVPHAADDRAPTDRMLPPPDQAPIAAPDFPPVTAPPLFGSVAPGDLPVRFRGPCAVAVPVAAGRAVLAQPGPTESITVTVTASPSGAPAAPALPLLSAAELPRANGSMEGPAAQVDAAMAAPPQAAGPQAMTPVSELVHAPPAAQVAVPVGQAEWARAVAQQVIATAQQQVAQARIELSPRELGPLELRVRVEQNDQASIWISATHPQAREALEAALPQLRERLAAEGMNLVQAQVSQQSPDQRPRGMSEPPAAAERQGESAPLQAETPATPRDPHGLIDDYA